MYHKFVIEVEFEAYDYNGMIFYNQQKEDGRGDFVSLALIDGFVVFKYNLGSGLAIIRSMEEIKLYNVHTVVIKRYHRDGILKVDDSEDVRGSSTGSMKALDLLEDAFIGHISTNFSK